jgi:hypothetical protein
MSNELTNQRTAGNRGAIRALIGMSIVAGIGVLAGSGPTTYEITRRTAMGILAFLLLMFNASWWVRADWRLVVSIRSFGPRRFFRVMLLAYVAAVCWPVVDIGLKGEWRDMAQPTWWTMWLQLWHMGLVVALGLWWPIKWGAVAVSSIWRRIDEVVMDRGRRAWLQQAVVAGPILVVGGATVRGQRQTRDLALHRHEVYLPQLPRRLAGLTITHVSDFHVGRYFRPEYLPELVDRVNYLKSDVILVTGDVIDHSNDMLPETAAALQQFEAVHGMHLAIGNHDLIDDGRAFVSYCRQENLPLMLNERKSLSIGGETLHLGSLNWGNFEDCAWETFGSAPVEGCAIAMAHHPHAFDALASRGVALTLSGHTHGGQLMFTRPGASVHAGVGRLLFRYTRGFYRKERSRLFVNSGVGNWFPVRVHAPAEIVQLTLV